MALGIGRRELIAGLGSAALAWPLAARAQQPAVPVVGYLSGTSPDDPIEVSAEFRRGLAEAGHVEGRNLAIEYRWLEGHYDQIPTMLADLVKRRGGYALFPYYSRARDHREYDQRGPAANAVLLRSPCWRSLPDSSAAAPAPPPTK